ncbi:PAS domain-containing protein [Flavitalea flava]
MNLFLNIVKQAPVGITIFRGKEFIVEMANATYLQIVDRTEASFVGKPLFESLPEVKEAVAPLLNQVLETGIPYYGNEFEVQLNRHGHKETTYFNFIYQPLYEDAGNGKRPESGKASGIMVVANEVTAQVLSKHILAESEKQFRDVVTRSPIAMTIFRGKDLIIEMANEVLLNKIWKRALHEVQGKKLLDVFPELKGQQFPGLLHKVQSTGIAHSENEAVAFVNGPEGLKKYWLDYEYAPLFEKDKSVSRIMVTVNDVTEKVEARQKIEDNKERLRLATEGTRLATWDLNLQTLEIIHSPRLAEIFGYPSSAIISHPQMRSDIHPDDLPIVKKAFELALQTGIYYYEARVVWRDQTTRWIRTRGQVIFDDSHTPLRMLGTLMDITEARSNEEKIVKTNKTLELALDAGRLGTFELDVTTGLFNFNDRCKANFGFPLDEQNPISLQKVLSAIHGEDKTQMESALHNALENKKPFQAEYRIVLPDQTLRWIASSGRGIYDETGSLVKLVGITSDITERKSMEEELERKVQERTRELKQANEVLVKVNQELSSFAYISSHDLQEPLRKIQTFASRLIDTEKDQLSDKGKEYLGRMENAAERMRTLIGDILSYSRTSNTEKIFKETDLNEVISDIKEELKESLKEKNAEMEVGYLPTFNGIPFQLHQLFTNIISNSIKFARQDIPLHIRINVRMMEGNDAPGFKIDKRYYHISVTDNGIGFSQLYRERIFEVFQRLHGKSAYAGTGIGLAICKKIVENHEGIILAEGIVNEGATFHIYFPVA